MDLVEIVELLASAAKHRVNSDVLFESIVWQDFILTAKGICAGLRVNVELNFQQSNIRYRCSICGKSQLCQHVASLLVVLNEDKIARTIQDDDCAPCSFSVKQRKTKRANPWKSQLSKLGSICQYSRPSHPVRATFPSGREAIYVIMPQQYGYGSVLDIQVATRPVLVPETTGGKTPSKSKSIFKKFTHGVRGLAASGDPLDQHLAERLMLKNTAYGYFSDGGNVELNLSPLHMSELLGRLAMSGRLYLNHEHKLHDEITPLGWLGNEPFELKFEIASQEKGDLSLGLCATNSGGTIPHQQIKTFWNECFLDQENRIGVLKSGIDPNLKTYFDRREEIRIPRKNAGELIETVMGLPVGLPVEFIGCEDIAPQRLSVVPKPMIHIQAPRIGYYDRLNAEVKFDYDGMSVSSDCLLAEKYDKSRSAIVPIDQAFHARCREMLAAVGVKPPTSHGQPFSLLKSKLPFIVGELIRRGWHIEADGKLYRTGKRCELNVVSGIDWFELQGQADFEQTSIDLPKLMQALRRGENTVVLDDGSIGLIPEDWIKKFGTVAELANAEDGAFKFGLSQVGLLDALLAQQPDVNIDEKFAAARASLREFEKVKPTRAPRGFSGSLRPYQELAQGWFDFLRNMGFGGCLADDMGLGKTVQVLAMLEHRRQEKQGPSLIVVPRSLVFNWISEASKFTPQMRVLDQSHAQRTRGIDHLADYDLVLTTYGTLRRDAAILKDYEFDYVILDESQAIKNAATEAAKAARLLRGRHKLALSGTPIENHLGELWSLFDFLNPGLLGRVGRFAGLANDADAEERKLLAAAVRPFILRRTKKQVAPELPDRVEQTIIVELDADQRKSYNELRDYYRQSLLKKIESDGIGKSQIVILEALLRLRQAACHPGLIDKSSLSKPSAKLDELMSRLSSAVESGERVLVFSQFTSFLAIIKKRLDQEGLGYQYLDGKTRNRQDLVEQFQSGTGPGIFLISLKAGGVGLNLTAARTVYLLDPWWNPAVEAQAIDRTHRIGQHQTVFASRLIAADTVEQKVLELQDRKKGLADAIINSDNGGISSLTRGDLELLLA